VPEKKRKTMSGVSSNSQHSPSLHFILSTSNKLTNISEQYSAFKLTVLNCALPITLNTKSTAELFPFLMPLYFPSYVKYAMFKNLAM
jgi:hypothetical protein